jgi:DNA polymerase-3 subunit epsilon/CBS domain-containing protein
VKRVTGVVSWISVWMRRQLGLPAGGLPLDALLDPGFVAIDLETTGLDSRRADVVSLAVIPFVAGRPQPGFVTLIDPRRPIPPASTRIHGIDDGRVAGAPTLDAVFPEVDAACAGAVVVGHDVGYDLAVLKRARRQRRLPEPHTVALDTRRLAVALYPSWRHRAELEMVAGHFGIPVIGRHTAEGDARLAGNILLGLLPEFEKRGARTVDDLVWAQTSVFRRA